MQCKGVVKAIKTKEWNDKTMYNLGVSVDGEEKLKWFGFGAQNPGVREESVVSFDYKENDKGYLVGNAKTVQVHKDEKPPATAQAKSGGGGGFQDRQESITIQSAFNGAVAFLSLASEHGWFKPAANTKAAKEAALDTAFSVALKYAVELQGYYMDPSSLIEKVLADADNNVKKESNEEDFDSGEPFDDDVPF